MERDTATPSNAAGNPSDSSSISTDSAVAVTADTAGAANSEMARDTTSAAGTGDTATVAVTDSGIAAESDTTGNIQVQVDTATTEHAQADTTSNVQTDTAAVAAVDSTTQDSTQVDVANENAAGDTLQANAGRIRPPEDSTEVLGNVTTDSAAAGNGDVASQSESDRIRPPEDSTEVHGNVTSDNDRAAVGAAAMGGTATGAEAVALITRSGERCVMVNEESTEASWDIADSPANLNPCGTGTMTLSRVRTGETH
jgi:hypothetical protein